MLIESEFVMWIKETKGLCSSRTSVYCPSLQLSNLPPSATRPLPPSVSQPAFPASCLLCDSVGWGTQAVHVTDPIYPGFAKTMPERGLQQVVWGSEKLPPLFVSLHWTSSRTMVITSVWMPGGDEVQLCLLEGHENPEAGKEVEGVSSQKAAVFCRRHVTVRDVIRSHQDTKMVSYHLASLQPVVQAGKTPPPGNHSCPSSGCPHFPLRMQGVYPD